MVALSRGVSVTLSVWIALAGSLSTAAAIGTTASSHPQSKENESFFSRFSALFQGNKESEAFREQTWVLEEKFNLTNPRGGRLVAYGDLFASRTIQLLFLVGESSRFRLSCVAFEKGSFAEKLLIELPSTVHDPRGFAVIDVDADGLPDVTVAHLRDGYFDLLVLRHSTDSISGGSAHNFTQIFDSAESGVRSTVEPSALDVNFDGLIDFMGQAKPSSHTAASGGRFIYRLRILPEGRVLQYDPLYWTDPELKPFLTSGSSVFPPLAQWHNSAYIDMDGDCIPDLVIDTEIDARQQQRNLINQTPKQDTLASESSPAEQQPEPQPQVSSGDSAASTANGGRILEVWLARPLPAADFPFPERRRLVTARPLATFVHAPDKSLRLPPDTVSVFFGSLTGSGAVDVGVAACQTASRLSGICEANDRLVIYANRQPSICPSGIFQWVARVIRSITGGGDGDTTNSNQQQQQQCRLSTDFCVSQDFKWDSPNVTPLTSPTGGILHLRREVGKITTPVRLVDVDLDGFPDALVSTSSTAAVVMKNQLGPSRMQSQQWWLRWLLKDREVPRDPGEYYSRQLFHPVALLPETEGYDVASVMASPAAHGEPWIVLSRSEIQSVSWWHPQALGPAALIYRPDRDRSPFFLTVAGLSGGCLAGDCSKSPAAIGGTFKLVGVDLEGRAFARTVNQLPQSQQTPLLPPYTLTGLGHLNNYVDFAYYGLGYVARETPGRLAAEAPFAGEAAKGGGKGFPPTTRRWSSVVPNSDIYVNPIDRQDTATWRLMLAVNPSGYIVQIAAVAVGTLAAVGATVIYLEWRDKSEALQEHRGFRRHFVSV